MFMKLAISLMILLSALQALALTPSRYVKVNGLDVAVYESSGHKKPAVLLIHGNTSSAEAFTRIMKSSFARRHRVVALDMPGFGRSDNASTYNIALFNAVIKKVAEKTHSDRGVIVGWSLGGDLALQASSQLPHVKGYFFIGTAPVGNAPGLPTPFLTPAESYAGPAVNYGFFGALTPQQINDYVTAFFRPNYAPIPQYFYQNGQRTDGGTRDAILAAASGLDPDFQDEVSIVTQLDVPVALVVGEEEAFVRLAFLEGLAPQIPTLWRDEVVVVQNSGHAVQHERPHRTIRLLEKFIDDL